jgi:hypothetical protein
MIEMPHLLQFLTGKNERHGVCSVKGSGEARGDTDAIIAPGCFRSVLRRERMRAERSGRPLVVMFIDIAGIVVWENGEREIDTRYVQSLKKCIRGTDCMGWYEECRVLGIIFVDAPGESKCRLQERMTEGIRTGQVNGVKMDVDIVTCTFPFKNAGSADSVKYTLYGSRKTTPRERIYSRLKRMVDIVGGITGMLFFYQFFYLSR